MVSHREREPWVDVLGGGAGSLETDARGLPRPAQARAVFAPSEIALRRLPRRNQQRGHENAGFLSSERGFLPRVSPLTRLDPRFAAWDELASELPSLHHGLALRKRVESLPVLDASANNLSDRELLRASALLAILAHAYWYVDTRPPSGLPAALREPWAEVRRRLGRTQEVISYIDLIVYNWRVRDPRLAEPLVVENLELLFPTVGNQEERIFYLTQVEILARTSPVLRLAAAAQGAVLRRDHEELEAALYDIIGCLGRVVSLALPKIDPNPYGPTHVDPVIWAKTVAPFAVPLHRGDQGPSGTSSPIFNTLDIFFGRRTFSSFLGREIKQLRSGYPPAWQLFLRALARVPVGPYIAQHGSRALKGAYQEAFELYASETGFLGRHRMKVYGFLELAFKVGRAVTIGGFGGVFTDRTWDLVDDALAESQSERTRQLPSAVHRARVVAIEPAPSDRGGVRRVTLDIGQAGVRYRTGDRCLIMPENDPVLVERTLRALDRSGDELVQLTEEWRAYGAARAELVGRTAIPLRELLRFGSIRPVSPRLAEALHARTQSPLLLDATVRGATERWELWELLEHLRARGIPPDAWCRREGTKPSDELARLVPPQRFRVYSVSSAPRSPLRRSESTLELTIGPLRYDAVDAPPTPDAPRLRTGSGSGFLTMAGERGLEVPFRIVHPEIFRLPDDPATPIVMFAGGSGIAPFRAFLEERRRSSRSGPSWLLLSVRTPDDFPFERELTHAVAAGQLRVDVAFTRTGTSAMLGADGRLVPLRSVGHRIDDLMRAPDRAARLAHLARAREAGGAGAMFYICGRGGFAERVLQTLKSVFAHGDPTGTDAPRAARMLYHMVGERRLVSEVHTDAHEVEECPRLFDVSEIAEHNDDAHGYWIVIDRVVYDMTEFMELHPGGRRVVSTYAGMDATHGFARAHYGRPEVDAMRETYRIGLVRTLSFDDHVVRVDGPTGALAVDSSAAYRAFAQALQLVVEMQNALVADQSLFARREETTAPRMPYVLQRGFETHQRFLKNCFQVLTGETLSELWRIGHGLFFPEQPADWMRSTLERLAHSPAARTTAHAALHAFDAFDARGDAALPALDLLLDRFAAADAWFLRSFKAALIAAVRAFERHGAAVRTRGGREIRRACRRAVGVAQAYHGLVSRSAGAPMVVADRVPRADAGHQPPTIRLHTGLHWSLDEHPHDRIAVLRRTPAPVSSLAALVGENDQVLGCLQAHHRAQGLVVDMRQARLRNDAGFEDAMARLRRELTAHFKRMAVLLESSIGELQVSRIERDERRHAIATRSESTAFKFARGAETL